MSNLLLAQMVANLALQMAGQPPAVGPMPEPPGRGMEVRSIYPERFNDELGKVYSDWEGDPKEKMVFLDKKDRMGVLGGQKDRLGTSLKELIGLLARNNMSIDALQEIVHNHNSGEKISPADEEMLRAVRKLGFAGRYSIYTPKTHRLKTEE